VVGAPSIRRAHVLGWSLGSLVAQEFALADPERVASLVLYGTWARADGVMASLMTALKYPLEAGDVATVSTVSKMSRRPRSCSPANTTS
jgi:pimeloyl-ACP methyl ester carboxylesterase